MQPDSAQVLAFLRQLQEDIVARLAAVEDRPFVGDAWQRAEGGGGIGRVVEGGQVLERAGVNFSHVAGAVLPPSASAGRPDLAGGSFEAMGVSLVIHPRNPFAPTTHMNTRFFVVAKPGAEPAWWFGGGMDLTPCYGFDEDAVAFHRACRDALDPFGAEYYPRFKRACDEYFFVRHRQEPRGIGGVFFEDFNERGFAFAFSLAAGVARAFSDAYLPILQRRMDTPYGPEQRDFQAYRRGRYVEFNLVQDRGTLFGLQSGGRAESILMSMPPAAHWRYNWMPQPGSAEERLTGHFLVARDWLA